jgi:sigma-E factor negative regulatory protein RseC
MSDGKRGYIRVLPGEETLEHYKINDQVQISIPEEVILRGSFIAYGLPTVSMLAGALLAVNGLSGNEDLLAAVGAVVGLTVGYGVVRWHGRYHRRNPDFQPVLLGIAPRIADPVTIV